MDNQSSPNLLKECHNTDYSYYEVHVTIEYSDKRELLTSLVTPFRFRLAKLYMDKTNPSVLDCFLTGRDSNKEVLAAKTQGLIETLKENGFKLLRVKMEATIFDFRFKENKNENV